MVAIHDPPEHHPVKGAFNDPTFGQDCENMFWGSFHDFEFPASMIFDPFDKFPGISAVSPNDFDLWKKRAMRSKSILASSRS
nr:hypothetical protein [Geminisphaera colitermitum]